MAKGRETSDLISCLREIGHTPFKRVKVDALERDPMPADTTQCFVLIIEANENTVLLMQGQCCVKAFDPRHVTGVAEQNRRIRFIKGVIFNWASRACSQ